MEIFTIETDDVNKRVDVFLNEEMEDVSRSALQKNIEKGNITVNGEKISKNYKLRLGDIVEAELPPPENIDIVPEDISLDIMYEDNDLIVINKPQKEFDNDIEYHLPKYLVNHKYYKNLYDKKHREFVKVITGLENSKDVDENKLNKYKYWLKELNKYES